MPNLAQMIITLNKKIMKTVHSAPASNSDYNCQNKPKSILNNDCIVKDLIYSCTVTKSLLNNSLIDPNAQSPIPNPPYMDTQNLDQNNDPSILPPHNTHTSNFINFPRLFIYMLHSHSPRPKQ